MSQSLELIAEQETKAQPFFKTDESYQVFCQEFVETVTPDLDRYREARQKSEEEAKRRWMR